VTEPVTEFIATDLVTTCWVQRKYGKARVKDWYGITYLWEKLD